MELNAVARTSAVATFAVIVLILPLSANCEESQRKCGPFITTPGFTVPQGDIAIREGNPLEIFCVLTSHYHQGRYHNATDLRFYHNTTLVESEYLQVLNETTLRYYMDKAPPMKAMFYCKLKPRTNSKEQSVCLNTVTVGYEPLGVDNLSCISYNWQSLNCTWVPKYNPVPTTYRIFFQLRNHDPSAYRCPDSSDKQRNTCVWTEASDPSYRQSHPVYKLTLAGENALKNKTFSYEMDHFKYILPAPPTNLKVVNMTSSSLLLKWTVPFPMNTWARSYTLLHKVAYATNGAKESADNPDPFTVAFVGTPVCSYDQSYVECYYNLTGLEYAYYLYDIRVFIKTENATDAFWSKPEFVVKKTAPMIPPQPPSTDIGSFEVAYNVPYRDVTLYWKSLPENLYSGANFSYRIVDISKNDRSSSSVKVDLIGKKSAVLRNLSMHDTFAVRIASSNEMGDSLNTSLITIPSFNETLPEPESFTKTSLRGGEFKLTWNSPKKFARQVTNYTIFWCDSQTDRPDICTGLLNWKHVGKDERELTVRLKPTMYHFAISANSERGSSGMVWASCSMVADKVDKLKTVYVNRFDATSLDVEWKLDCTDANNVVKGFIIFYCVANPGMVETCKDSEQNVTIDGDHNTRSAKLTNLEPYVTYRITVAIKTEVGRSLASDPILKTLSEAAPSTPPTDIKVTDVTNNSITISWTPPSKPNGVLRYYEINCNGNHTKVKFDVSKHSETLTNLVSYTNYSIQMRACTLACSDVSPPVTAQTLIGVPGSVNNPRFKVLNDSYYRLSWGPPNVPGGKIDYYHISVGIVGEDGKVHSTTPYNVTGTEYQVPVSYCKTDPSINFNFSIRAVNVDGDSVLMGEESDISFPCYKDEKALIVVLYSILGVVGALFFFGVAGWYGRSFYRNCREIRELAVKIPTGLLPDDTKDPVFNKKISWTPHDHDNDDSSANTRPADTDKERLLQRKDDRHGESSGCSSGHDTVSSSTTSGTHISADSGTEMDQNEPGFTDSPKWAAGANTAVDTAVNTTDEKKLESEGDESPYVHVGTPISGQMKPLYPNLEAANMLPAAGGYVTMTSKEGTFAPQTKPSRGYVAQASVAQASPAQASPAQTSPAQTSPAQASPAQASPAQASPAQASPAQASPAQASPAQASLAQASLAQASLAQASLAQASLAQASLAQASLAQASPALWREPVVFFEGYVQTGPNLDKDDGVVVGSECVDKVKIVSGDGVGCERKSVEVPLVPTRTPNGYVTHPAMMEPTPKAKPTPNLPQVRHEYVRTAEKKPSTLISDNSKPYTRLGEREPPNFFMTSPPTTTTPTPTGSGYVPHRQFDKLATPGVGRE